ncbi:MAG: two-component sensor histidine kinase [Curvibacter sp.]|nr:two-component sensor histidine kinase [Curvibacter sp.]
MVVASVLIVLSIAWGAVAEVLNLKWHDAIEAEVQQNTNLSSALQEQTVRVLATVDQATLRMRDSLVSGEFTPADFKPLANETGLVPKILTQLSLIGPDGRFVGSNLDPSGEATGHVDLSGREHFKVHVHPDQVPEAARQLRDNGLFIGKPVLGKVSDKWTIQLSRKIVKPNGELLGVVVASLNPNYFEDVYKGVDLGPQGGVILVGEDRTVRARVIGGKPSGMGSNLPVLPEATEDSRMVQGHFIRVSRLDGVERIFAFRRIAAYPLLVYVATSTEGALAEWRSLRTVTVTLTALFSLATIVAATILLTSIRRLQAKNRALQISEAQAQSASQAKSEFLAAISHELRTPLTSIRGFAELMELRLEQPKFKEQAKLIRKAAEHLNALLTEILDLAKVEAGAMPVNAEPQDLRDIIQSSGHFFGVTAATKGLSLAVNVADEVPATLVCDGLRLKQILNNLLSNAMKFTLEGGVTIEADADADHVRVHVVDTGPGIPEHLHETIFEKFRQGNDRVSYEHGGTGLGLALSRALATLMGGTLTLVSSPGHGARFTLTLPRT